VDFPVLSWHNGKSLIVAFYLQDPGDSPWWYQPPPAGKTKIMIQLWRMAADKIKFAINESNAQLTPND
jgi:hypothetical protein